MLKKELLVSCIILLLGLTFSGCDNKDKLTEIDFNDTVELQEFPLSKVAQLNICIGSMITPKEGYVYYKALLDYIGNNLGMKANFIEKKSYSETNRLLEEGKIDMAFICGGPYVDGHDNFALELLVAPQVDGKTVYHSFIIVHKDSPVNKFEDLRGKTFVFVDLLSNTGWLYPVYLLRKMAKTPEIFFRDYIYSHAHDASIRAVAENIVDGGAVDSLIWNYMDKTGSQFVKNTRIIQVSPPYGIPPVVVAPSLNKDLKEKIKQILLNMHKDEEGKDILEKMHIDKFVEIEDSNYNSIRKVKEDLKK